ncbi:MAG: hypothetical protein UHY90_10975 [Treponema sp.]|nr:hypothetical protein [Treponema sp.]
MKKTLIAVAAAAALTTSAFAEITFGAWLRAIPTPIASTGEDTVAGATSSWGWGCRTARLDVNAVSEDGKAGYSMGIFNDMNDGLGAGNHALLWVKPIDQVKVSVGKFDSPDNGLRGDFCYGSWNWLRPYNWIYDGEGLTFDGVSKNGLMVEADPVDALHVFVAVPLENTYEKTAETVYRNIQAGFGYSIDGIGKIKAQFVGDYSQKNSVKTNYSKEDDFEWDAEKGTFKLKEGVEDRERAKVGAGKKDDATTGKFGVAFDLTAVENLYVTVGARFGIADKDYCDADYLKMSFAAGASYQVADNLKVSASGTFYKSQEKAFGKKDDKKDNKFDFGAGVDFTVADGLTATADVRFLNTGYGKDGDDNSISFLVGLNKSVSSNGSIGVGFQGATNGNGLVRKGGSSSGIKAGWNEDGKTTDEDQFCWAIPVSVSVWF